MTYILHHEAPARFETQPQVKLALRVVRKALAIGSHTAASLALALAQTPMAISRAFASAYADPFQPKHIENDPADPQNF